MEEKNEDFNRFIYFIIGSTTLVQPWYEKKLCTLIQAAEQLKLQNLELDLIHHYNTTPFNQNSEEFLKKKEDFALRSLILTLKLEIDSKKSIQCFLGVIKYKKEIDGKVDYYDMKYDLTLLKTIKKFSQEKKLPYYSLFYSLKAECQEFQEQRQSRLKFLIKERELLYLQINSKTGQQMFQNSKNLYLLSKHEDCYNKQSMKFYKRAMMNNSELLIKVEIIPFFLQEYLKNSKIEDQKAQTKLKKFINKNFIIMAQFSPFLHYLCVEHINSQYPHLKIKNDDIISEEESKSNLNFTTFKQIRKLLTSVNPFYSDLFKNYLDKNLKESISVQIKQFESLDSMFQFWQNSECKNILDKTIVIKEQQIEDISKFQEAASKVFNFLLPENPVQIQIDKLGSYFGAYDGQKFNGSGYLEFEDGRKYIGEFSAGQIEGKGEFFWPEGHIYVSYQGSFKDSFEHGKGYLVYSNGETYSGEFKFGLRDGKGKLTQLEQIYDGEWKEDQKCGKGKETYLKLKECYDGKWFRNMKEGTGNYYKDDRLLYSGSWLNNLKHGQGTYYYSRETYQGSWFEGRRHGRGLLSQVNGYSYDGNWDNGSFLGDGSDSKKRVIEKEGIFYHVEQVENKIIKGMNFTGFVTGEELIQGEFTLRDGSILNGWFENGRLNGVGQVIHTNKERYSGDFVKNKKNGIGFVTLAGGHKMKLQFCNDQQLKCKFLSQKDEIYYGYTLNNKKQGFGVYTNKKLGFIFYGGFYNDKMSGKGSIIYDSGDQYEGDTLNGEKHGTGTIFFKGGSYVGEFKEGKYHGKGVLKIDGNDGYLYKGEFYEGKKSGIGVFFKKSDSYKGEFKNDMKEGLGIETIENSTYQGMFKNDQKTGLGSFMSTSESYEGLFQDGVKDGFCKHYEVQGGKLVIAHYGQYLGRYLSGIAASVSSKFQGEYSDGLYNGRGEILTPRWRYIGYFNDCKQQGEGLFFAKGNYYYVGGFHQNKFNGSGMVKYDQKSASQKNAIEVGLQKLQLYSDTLKDLSLVITIMNSQKSFELFHCQKISLPQSQFKSPQAPQIIQNIYRRGLPSLWGLGDKIS